MRHRDLQALVLLNLPDNCRLFKNTAGVAQYKGRFVRHGLSEGVSDLIGGTIVGGRMVFTAVELKGEKDKPRAAQLRFLQWVARSGGIAAVVRRVEDLPAVFDPQRIARGEVYDNR